VQGKGSTAPLPEFGLSVIDVDRFAAFFRAHGLAKLEGYSVAAYLDAAEDNLRRYITDLPAAASAASMGVADAWTISELRLRFERLRHALVARAGYGHRLGALPLDQFVQSDAEDAETVERSANEAHQAGNWIQAEACWARHRARFIESPDGHLLGAVALLGLGRLKEADSLLAQGLAEFPKLPQMWGTYAVAAQIAGDLAGSRMRWVTYSERFPSSPHGYTFGIELLRQIGRDDEAQSLLSTALQVFPEDPRVIAQIAWTDHLRGDWSAASARWLDYSERFPGMPIGYSLAVTALLQLRRFDDAENVCRAGLGRLPDNPELLEKYAYVSHVRQDWPEAVRRWRRLSDVVPGHQVAVKLEDVALARIGSGLGGCQ